MPTSSAVLPWIDLTLEAKGHPPTGVIVAEGRSQQPRPKSWDAMAQDISERTGGYVTGETLRYHFGHLDEGTAA